MDINRFLFELLIRELGEGRKAALCVVVETQGSTPQVPGAMMVIDSLSQAHGTIGGGCVEANIRKQAFELLSEGRSDLVVIDLDHEMFEDDGMICGGTMTVAVLALSGLEAVPPLAVTLEELSRGRAVRFPLIGRPPGKDFKYFLNLEPQPVLLISGAGHIAQELAKLAVNLGFRVCIADNRADFADARRFPPPIEIRVGDIGEILRAFPIDPSTYVVIVTRGHRHDRVSLEAVIRSPARYLGMIGSRRKVRLMFQSMRESGIDPELLERVHAPIGLSINGVTVQEIAVSIAAQLIQVRRQGGRNVVEKPASPPFPEIQPDLE